MLSRKFLLPCLLAVVILGVGVFAWQAQRSDRKIVGDTSNQTASNGIDYGPPTQEEIDAGNQAKQENTVNNPPPDSSSGKKNVNVIITDAGQYGDTIEVRSFVPDNFQDGTCTTTFTQGSQTIVKEMPAKTDVSTTLCMNLNVNRSEFPTSGDWQVKVAYSSANATGTSALQTISIK